MICTEGEVVEEARCELYPRMKHDSHVLSQKSRGKRREFICSLSPDLSALMMLSLLERYRARGWWLWWLLPLLHDLIPSLSLSLSARRQIVCWHRGVFHVCFHACSRCAPALLLCERSEAFGSAGANEMYHWPHKPAALNTLLSVYTLMMTSNTHWTCHSSACVWNLEAQTHCVQKPNSVRSKTCVICFRMCPSFGWKISTDSV